jgi:hypothetical protein
MMRKWKTSDDPSARQLDKLIEEAIVDAYDEPERANGFCCGRDGPSWRDQSGVRERR